MSYRNKGKRNVKKLQIFLWSVFGLVSVSSCELIKDEKIVRRYSIENQTGVPITIKSYDKGEDGTIYDGPRIINLQDGEELVREERLSVNTDYDFANFFGGAEKKHETIEVVFNKVRKKVYVSESLLNYQTRDSCINVFYKKVACTYRNPLLKDNTATDRLKFVFIEEDYQNAENCDGECE